MTEPSNDHSAPNNKTSQPQSGSGWDGDGGWAAEDDWTIGAPADDVFDRGWRYEPTDQDAVADGAAVGTRTTGRRTIDEPTSRNDHSAAPTRPKGRVRERDQVAYVQDREYDLYDEAFPAPKRGRGCLAFLIVASFFVGAALLGLRWYQRQVDPPGLPGQTVNVVIPSNTSTAKIGEILHDQGIIGNANLFRFYAQFKGKGGFEAGKYEFKENSSFDETLDILTLGAQVPESQKLTIPEGFRYEQIGARVEEKLDGRTAANFRTIATAGKVRSTYQPAEVTSLEGFLFPSTYVVSLEDDEATIASRMVEQFDQIADEVKLSEAKGKVGISPYEALIVASLIEREAKLESDRAKIARVIYNRLKTDRALQIDATIIYGLGGGLDRVLLEDLEKDGPYNSYTRKGLPPTPIANPGRASMEAALNPVAGDWLYYVVTGADGSHSFANTFKEHKRNIQLAKDRGLR
jgi:UPF0755 protein